MRTGIDDGLVSRQCNGSVADVMARLETELSIRGIATFAVIDHSSAAHSVGLELSEEIVVIFGNPAIGTMLMQANPRVAIELPLRVLIRDDGGTSTMEYLPPTSLSERFSLERESLLLDRLDRLLHDLAVEISG
jgi:uncharacterized protein (DUF302 family)